MPHPITLGDNKAIRDRVVSLTKEGLHRTSATNIIFVCGGEGEDCLRPKFIEYMHSELTAYIPFKPEAAQEDYFEQDHEETLNLADFEELISDLSLGIVLFAESPGSYAEVGLFSALEHARKKTLVVLDASFQGQGSFLAFGPVATISKHSRLGAAIQFNFTDPQFDLVRDRIKSRIPVPKTRRSIGDKKWGDLNSLEIMALTWYFVKILRACSLEDVIFLFNSAFSAHASDNKIQEIVSVLVGADILTRCGPTNLLKLSQKEVKLAEPSKSFEHSENALLLEINEIIEIHNDPNYLEALDYVG